MATLESGVPEPEKVGGFVRIKRRGKPSYELHRNADGLQRLRCAEDMQMKDVRKALTRIRDVLSFGEDQDGVEVCDPNLAVGGADAVDAIYNILNEYQLLPVEEGVHAK